MLVVTTSQEVLRVPSAIHVQCIHGREDKASASEHLLPYVLKLFGMWNLSSRYTLGVISSRVKAFNLIFKMFLYIPILFSFQFTKQAVIETYTLFLSNFKTATEAIKTTCQAKPAFGRFLEVNREIAFLLKLCGTVHATLRI
jgi:hypothetical protein